MGLHFDFSPEQRMLGNSVRGLLAREAKPVDRVETDAVRAFGRRLAEHGLFGVMTPVEKGGVGLGLTDALAVALETGRVQARYPVIETIAAARLLADVAPGALPRVLICEDIVTCAQSSNAELIRAGDEIRIRGDALVPFADGARWLALAVRRSDTNEPGPWATVIDLSGPGVDFRAAPEFDLTYPVFHAVLDAPIDHSAVVHADVSQQLAILACGELTGAAEMCLERTLHHLKERVQFGRPIGTNQSLRHRAADSWIAVQNMQAASEYAAASFDAAEAGDVGTPVTAADAQHAAHVAKAYCSMAGRKVAQDAIQLHGGIGFTWEFGLHVPVRRILRLVSAYGAAADHHGALADLLLNGNGRRE